MKHGSLFSGIGGFDLAAERMGWKNSFHCEINSFCRKVLNYYWPKAESYEDITKTDFTIWRGRISVLSGGFPCQPYSAAGKRLGTEDERHLWPQMLRAIREIQPRWVVGENVRGLVNWSGGLVFEEVQADLEAQGYEVQPFLLPDSGVGAPHQRERIWFIAYTCKKRLQGSQQQRSASEKRKVKRKGGQSRQPICGEWEEFPTQSPIRGRNDGIPEQLDGITISKWGNESIKAYGNAIVPQVAIQIFKSIQLYEDSLQILEN